MQCAAFELSLFVVVCDVTAGRKVFREFLRSEYSEENLLFWLACEDLKRSDADMVEEKARLIYEDYISILSPKEVSESFAIKITPITKELSYISLILVGLVFQVSLDARVREIINHKMVEPSATTFDEAQLQIFTLMHRDSYPRFLSSHVYKKHLPS